MQITSSIQTIVSSTPFIKQLLKQIICLIHQEPFLTWSALQTEELYRIIGKNDPIIIEVGSNDGTHTKWFLQTFDKAHIVAFEPDPRARKRFREMVQSDQVQLHDYAIAAEEGETKFYMSTGTAPSEFAFTPQEGWDQSGSIKMPLKHLEVYPWCTFKDSIAIQTKRLDTWFADSGLNIIDLLWADVQGAEEDLIKGAEKTLKQTRYFYTEYSNKELYQGQISLKKLLQLLPDFDVVHRYESDILLINKQLV